MKKKSFILIVIMILQICINQLFAENNYINNKTNQSKLHNQRKNKKINDFIKILLQRNPDIAALNAELKGKKAEVLIAQQIINPELDFKLEYESASENVAGEYSFLHTIEFGGKIKKRKKNVRAKYSVKELEVLIKKQEIVKDFILLLYRVGQINYEIEVLNEAIISYRHQLKLYKKFPRLSPEMYTSQSIYVNLVDESKLNLSQLINKKESLKAMAQYMIDNKDSSLFSLIPRKIVWPKIRKVENIEGPYIELAKKKIKLSETYVRLADSIPWPDMKLGPTFSHSGDNKTFNYSVGITASIPIPIYNQNKGEKESTRANLKARKIQLKSVEKKMNYLRNSYSDQYNNFIKRLKSIKHVTKNYASHKRIHYNIAKGLVHPSIIIEAHRQRFELFTKYHEIELEALQLLWSIYAIDGIVFKGGTK